MAIQTSNRNSFLDFAKATAILCVVFGHCIQYGSGADILRKGDFFDNPIFIFIYSFHMPLFMLISGYLFSYSANRRSILENVQNKFMTLFVPIIVWGAVSCLISSASDLFHSRPIHLFGVIKSYISCILFNLWFLWAIFWSSIIVLFIRKFFNDSFIAYLCVIITSLFVPNMYNIHMYSFMFPYYVLGYKYNNYSTNHRCEEGHCLTLARYKSKLFLGVSILFFVLLMLYNRGSYIYITGYYILNGDVLHQLYNNIYRFCIGLVGSGFFLLLLDKFYSITTKGNKLRPFFYIGQKTMGIYIIQGYIIPWIMVRITKDFQGINYGIATIESIIIITLCLLFIYVLNQTEITKKMFLGGK